MAQPKQHNSIEKVLELLNQPGRDSLREAFSLILNAAMLLERQQFLNTNPYERTPERRDNADGIKTKHLQPLVGQLDPRVPQVRSSEFYSSALERVPHSERGLKLAFAEM